VSQVARQRGINASQLFAWRRQAVAKGLISDHRSEASTVAALTFTPVTVTDKPAKAEATEDLRPARRGKLPRSRMTIEIELKGSDRVRLEGSTDGVLVARMVAALRRARYGAHRVLSILRWVRAEQMSMST
jgi:transposase-like protein